MKTLDVVTSNWLLSLYNDGVTLSRNNLEVVNVQFDRLLPIYDDRVMLSSRYILEVASVDWLFLIFFSNIGQHNDVANWHIIKLVWLNVV